MGGGGGGGDVCLEDKEGGEVGFVHWPSDRLIWAPYNGEAFKVYLLSDRGKYVISITVQCKECITSTLNKLLAVLQSNGHSNHKFQSS